MIHCSFHASLEYSQIQSGQFRQTCGVSAPLPRALLGCFFQRFRLGPSQSAFFPPKPVPTLANTGILPSSTCARAFQGVPDLYDLRRLLPLVNQVHLSSASSLIISDVDGQLGGLQLLVAVTLAAGPDINILQKDRK